MGMTRPRPGVLDDTIWVVLHVLEEHVDVPTERLYEIAAEVSGMGDVEAQRARILELAGVVPTADDRAA